MKRLIPVFLAPVLVWACSGSPEATDAPTMVGPAEAFQVPVTPTVDVVDNYRGGIEVAGEVEVQYFDVQIADPYRWLEDQDGEDTAIWVQEQNAVTHAYLAGIPEREGIRQRLTELWNYPRYSPPEKAGDRWLYGKNDGLQNQAVLYVTDDPMADGEVLLDPNTFSEDGTVALSGWQLSRSGRYLAYSTSASGSDWREWHVLDMQSGDQLGDTVPWSKFAGVAWTPDEAGFFYQRFPAPQEGQTYEAVNEKPQLCYHELGTGASEDIVVYERPDQPRWMFGPVVTEDGRYLVIHLSEGTDPRNRVVYASLEDGIGPVQPLLTDFDAMYAFLGNNGDVFYFHTDNLAPMGRVIALDIHKPRPEIAAVPGDPEATDVVEVTEVTEGAGGTEVTTEPEVVVEEWWDTVVPEANQTLEAARLVADRFVLTYLADASSRVLLREIPPPEAEPPAPEVDPSVEEGEPPTREEPIVPRATEPTGQELVLPGVGTASGFTGKKSDRETFFSFTSFTTPSTILRYDFEEEQLSVFREPELRFDPNDFETRRVFHSVEGTRLPLFLVHKKGIVLDGSNPTLLYGYGGFNISMTPGFSVSNLVFVEMGGIYAHAILRGGGEYGEAWHQAGMLENKQNVFNDFIGQAEYLLRNLYTSTPKLAIAGGSNGGLLVGAVLTQRPELFGAAVPQVGVMDMLRYHEFTIGWAWVPEFGSSADEMMFPVLRAYSPLHNLQLGRSYPPTLVMTGDHDDRVLPGHSYKFAATMQRAQGGTAPILIRVDTNTGHGGGTPTDKQIEAAADRLAFLVEALGMQ